MIKTQLNPFHRLYTIKLALDALLLYGKSGLIILMRILEHEIYSSIGRFISVKIIGIERIE
jgi:hypothetical protein